MKSILTISTLLAAAALLASLALEVTTGRGADAHALDVFASFVVALIALLAFEDYARPARVTALATRDAAEAAPKSEHALAA